MFVEFGIDSSELVSDSDVYEPLGDPMDDSDSDFDPSIDVSSEKSSKGDWISQGKMRSSSIIWISQSY